MNYNQASDEKTVKLEKIPLASLLKAIERAQAGTDAENRNVQQDKDAPTDAA